MKNTDRVIVYAASHAQAKQVALVLHNVLGLSLGETMRRANAGEPVAHISIWGNEHNACAEQLRAILQRAPDAFVFDVVTQSGGGAEHTAREGRGGDTAREGRGGDTAREGRGGDSARETAEGILGLLDAHEEHAAILEAYDAKREAARGSE